MSAATPEQAATPAVPPKRAAGARELPWWVEKILVPIVFLVVAAALPFFFDPGSGFISTCALALAYTVMALGLNIIVGFAGLLDLGFVAFYAIGAYTIGWLGSGFFSQVGDEEGWHIFVSGFAETPAGHPHELPARAGLRR